MNEANSIPYIGNTLIKDFLKIGAQRADMQSFPDARVNYSGASYLLKNVAVEGNISGRIIASIVMDFEAGTGITYLNPAGSDLLQDSIVIEEIDSSDNLVASYVIGKYNKVYDSGTGVGLAVNDPTPLNNFTFYDERISLNSGHVYALVFILYGGDHWHINKTILEFKSDSGSDLRFPPSPFVGLRPCDVLTDLTERLTSKNVDANGFALIDPDNPYTASSVFLTSSGLDPNEYYGSIPYNQIYTSGNSLRVINGIQYYTDSIKNFFQTQFAINGCGLGISGNTLVMEELSYFFDSTTMALDLGSDIANLQVMPLTDYLGNNLQTGYTKQWQDFSQYIGNSVAYYGVDAFNIRQDYKLPVYKSRKDIDWSCPHVAEMYTIEAMRANQSTSAASSPASDNGNVVISVYSTTGDIFNYYAPDGTLYVTTDAYMPEVYGTAQDSDPTATTDPYVRGLAFPETAINLGLSPLRNMLRKGGLLNAILYNLEGSNISFQKQHWQLQNGNKTVEVSGIVTNLQTGGSGELITEVGDLTLPLVAHPLFRPVLFKFKTQYPVNTYYLIENNPYGYISFVWEGVEFKGFIWEISQIIGGDMATEFTLLALDAPIP
jgi:hypothetical protein